MSLSRARNQEPEIIGGGQLPCRKCKVNTAWGTLSDLGGMCFPCYRDYCQEIQQGPTRSMTLDEKKAVIARVSKVV